MIGRTVSHYKIPHFESHTGTPRWPPDGRSIVFDSLESGNWDLYGWIAVSPDEQWIHCGDNPSWVAELTLVENSR